MKRPKQEKTLVLIKPDGIQRSLIGEVVRRYERVGLKLVALKMLVPDASLIEKHYLIDPSWKQKVGEKSIKSYKEKGLVPPAEDPLKIADTILERLKKYLTSGPVIAMVWQGAHAIKIVRKITGGTEPLSTDVGTIRGDFVVDSYEIADFSNRSIRNIVHASTDSEEQAGKEIELWFPEGPISYSLVQEKILYDVNLDGILE
ncbi:MAG: nucleoside-diphosphate kinase [Patescibacteria group bacterium]|nr:nucleoside-diphosphate kinase [bacterium]MDZ4240782.1 nucleoside-diphosphate kinase [Patescibacteria group bacterium]